MELDEEELKATREMNEKTIEQEYVLKSKIKDKITILKMELRYDLIDNRKAIQVLEELLKED